MVQAIRPPMLSLPSPIRYTPAMTTTTLINCCASIAPLLAAAERKRIWLLIRETKATDFSHFDCITPSAPCVLMVSRALRLSTSVALRKAPAR